MKTVYIYILLFIILFSCSDLQTKTDSNTPIDSIAKTDSTIKNEKIISPDLNIQKFKNQIDSLLLIKKGNKYTYCLKTDTFYYSNNDIKTLKFKGGLFYHLISESITSVICNYFFVPNTQEMLRVYLIDATFKNKKSLKNKIDELKISMKDSMPGGFDCDYYVNIGLTPCHDYIMTSNNKLYWLNIYYPYSRNEFLKYIKCLKENVDTSIFKGQIMCFFGGECTDNNVP